jgi:hypothetical protein
MKRNTFPSSKLTSEKSRYMKNQSFSVKWRATSPVLGARLLHELRKELKECHKSPDPEKFSQYPSGIRVLFKSNTHEKIENYS